MQYLFRSPQQYQLFILQIASSLFCIALLLWRLHYIGFDFGAVDDVRDISIYNHKTTFVFLVWNLFLAWIPYFVSILLNFYDKNKYGLAGIILLLFIWLLFFPNAPYILTDLLHLRVRSPLPLWFDMMLILSFAWTGLVLGYLSLYEVYLFVRKKFSKKMAWATSIAAIVLGSFGVFMGRFLRMNSWDVFVNPFDLLLQLAHYVLHPLLHLKTLGLSVVLAVFLILGFMTFICLTEDNIKNTSKQNEVKKNPYPSWGGRHGNYLQDGSSRLAIRWIASIMLSNAGG